MDLAAAAKIPAQSSLPVLSSLRRFIREPLAFLTDTAAHHGPRARLSVFGRPFYLLSEPDDVEEVLVRRASDVRKDGFANGTMSRVLGAGLVTSDGALWKRQRRLAAGAFTPARIREYGRTMVSCTEDHAARYAVDGVVNLHREMSELTLDVAARTLFGADLQGQAQRVARDIAVFNDFLASSPEALLGLPSYLPTPRLVRFRKALASMDALVADVLRAREGSEDRGDLLSALFAARDESGQPMSPTQLRDECVTLLIAGHETTALLLTHTLYLLTRHPLALEQVERELHAVLGARLPSVDDAKSLPYLGAVIKEALRIYPPIWVIGRETTAPLELAGETLPKGASILVSPWVTQRLAKYFPEPEAFRPERWLGAPERVLPRLAYFPFGAGPRVCIGNHFAMMEGTLMLAVLLQRLRFTALADSALQFAPSVTLRPRGEGLSVRVAQRGVGA